MAATAPAQPRPRRAVEQPARRVAPTPAAPPRPRARANARPRLAGGVAWIVLVAALLAGIVALNVAALRLNLEVQRLNEEKKQLATENAGSASELSTLAASARIEAMARRKLGLVAPVETTYVRAARAKR
jgi:cell division protein FtsL